MVRVVGGLRYNLTTHVVSQTVLTLYEVLPLCLICLLRGRMVIFHPRSGQRVRSKDNKQSKNVVMNVRNR
jgi:hypothetical protein